MKAAARRRLPLCIPSPGQYTAKSSNLLLSSIIGHYIRFDVVVYYIYDLVLSIRTGGTRAEVFVVQSITLAY